MRQILPQFSIPFLQVFLKAAPMRCAGHLMVDGTSIHTDKTSDVKSITRYQEGASEERTQYYLK